MRQVRSEIETRARRWRRVRQEEEDETKKEGEREEEGMETVDKRDREYKV